MVRRPYIFCHKKMNNATNQVEDGEEPVGNGESGDNGEGDKIKVMRHKERMLECSHRQVCRVLLVLMIVRRKT